MVIKLFTISIVLIVLFYPSKGLNDTSCFNYQLLKLNDIF